MLVVAGAMAADPSAAQPYPARSIRLIVPFAPGGPNDIIGRTVAQKLNEQWGQPVVVENRGGAGGTIGLEMASKLAGDGYVLAVGGSSSLAVAPGLYAKLGYDPLRDFVPIANVAVAPYALAVNPRVPAKNVRELVAVSRALAGGLTYGTAGSGSMSHLSTELLRATSGAKLLHVPYKGAALVATDLIAGQIDMTINDYAALAPFDRVGKLRLLAVAGSRRAAVAPQLPTLAESGISGYAVDTWFGIVAPAGVPKEIVAQLNAAIVSGIRSADVRKRFADIGYEGIGDTPGEFAATIRTDIEKFARVIRSAGIRAE
jgi:tripartite-type tricarboxylate transporter receptor subunit TctC